MKWLRIAGIVVAVVILVALALPFFINANQFRPILEERLTAALGREVKIGDLKLSIFSGGASASDVTIADDPAFSKEPFLRNENPRGRRGTVAADFFAPAQRDVADDRSA